MSSAIDIQVKVVREAIEAMAKERGAGGADIYCAGLIGGAAAYLIRARGRRSAYNLLQSYADEVITAELPR